MANFKEYESMDATSLSQLVKKKKISPLELVETAIEKIEEVNPKLNAVITPMFEIALKEAKSDLPNGPFTGVPFLLKDLVAEYAGVGHGEGSNFLKGYVSPHHSELVKRFKKSGAIIIGKTNAPEFGLNVTTEPLRFGPTRNPWNTCHSTGGSSGGSAAAVSAGFVPMAHANDAGGSIRIPSSCCGIFGMKPTRGRNPLGPDYGELWAGLCCEHVVTRSVRDSATMLDATSEPDIGAPYFAPKPRRPFLEEMGADPEKLRIGFSTSSPGDTQVHPDCVSAVKDAVKLLEDLGHVVEEINLKGFNEQILGPYLILYSSTVTWVINAWSVKLKKEPTKDDFEPATWFFYEMGKQQSASNYVEAIQNLQKISRNFIRKFSIYDVLVTPTLAKPPVLLGTLNSTEEDPMVGLMRIGEYVPFTPICNITGQPAMSVPLFWNSDNLPVGTQFIGRYGDESTLFRLARQLEIARPWFDKKPNRIE